MLALDGCRCVGCLSCMVACQQEKDLQGGVLPLVIKRIFLSENRPSFVFSAKLCRQCIEPACLEACPAEALALKDGIVVQEMEQCIRCLLCVSACPYGAMAYAGGSGYPAKCDLCASRRKKGLLPACIQTCPVGALKVVGNNIPGQHKDAL